MTDDLKRAVAQARESGDPEVADLIIKLAGVEGLALLAGEELDETDEDE